MTAVGVDELALVTALSRLPWLPRLSFGRECGEGSELIDSTTSACPRLSTVSAIESESQSGDVRRDNVGAGITE